ncbi:hypothetical protein OY671_011840, partial [Metschnikowia pulcherrima]
SRAAQGCRPAGRGRGRDRVHPWRDRGDQPGRADSGAGQSQGRGSHPAVGAGAPFQHRASAIAARTDWGGNRRSPADAGRAHRSGSGRTHPHPRAQARGVRACVQRARFDASRGTGGEAGPCRRREDSARWVPGRRPPCRGREGARSRFLRSLGAQAL